MRLGLEFDCGLHPGHDGKRERRELRRQLLDAEPESDDQQRRGWQWRTLDCDWRLFNLLVRASGSGWIGGLRHNQFQHKPELERGHSSRRMQRELQSTAEWNRDRKPNHNIRCRNWSYAIDCLQLLS